jgi:hypothetical protein
MSFSKGQAQESRDFILRAGISYQTMNVSPQLGTITDRLNKGLKAKLNRIYIGGVYGSGLDPNQHERSGLEVRRVSQSVFGIVGALQFRLRTNSHNFTEWLLHKRLLTPSFSAKTLFAAATARGWRSRINAHNWRMSSRENGTWLNTSADRQSVGSSSNVARAERCPRGREQVFQKLSTTGRPRNAEV